MTVDGISSATNQVTTFNNVQTSLVAYKHTDKTALIMR